MTTLDTHYVQNQSSVQLTAGGNVRISIPQSNLTLGDRYLALWKGLFGPEGGRGRYRLNINGTIIQNHARSAALSGGEMKESSGCHVFTAGSSGNVRLEAVSASADVDKRWSSEQMLLINLDDALLENIDWFFAENLTNDVPGTSYGGENEKPSVTFTPDGTSNYLVIANLGWDADANNGAAWRLRDVTNAADLAFSGSGGGNIGDEDPSTIRMAVLSAPAAVPLTLEVGYKSTTGVAKTKDHARLFVLRLDAFTDHGFVQSDLAATPTGARQAVSAAFQVTPAANGEVLLLSSFTGEADPGFESGHGYRADIEYDSAIEFDTQAGVLGNWVGPSAMGSYVKADTVVANTLLGKLVGQAVAATDVQGFTHGESNSGSEHTLRHHTLVAITTEVPASGEPNVSNEDPAPTTTNVDRTDRIGFHVGGVAGVDLATLEVDVQIGGQGYIPAVNAGVAQLPFDGNNTSILAVTDGYDVILDYRGVYPAGATVDVRVNADNVPGSLSMTQVDYSFTVSQIVLRDVQLVQIAKA